MNYSLYQENLATIMGKQAQHTFRNAQIDLSNYHAFLKNVERKLKELAVIEVKLKQIKTEKDEEFTDKVDSVEFLFQYEILDTNKQVEEIEKRLFNVEIKCLYETKVRQKGERYKENQVEIANRNGDEKQLWFNKDFGDEITLYIRQEAYQIKKQIEAIERLRDQPLKEHLPLLKLFENGKNQRFKKVEFDYHEILTDENQWKVLKPQKENKELRDGTSEQREFVKKALATSDFAMLEGPPGSGKTTSIIELIIQLCQQDKRVLLCSSTHVAVDNVLKRILTNYKTQCKDWVAPIRIAHDSGQIRYDEVKAYRLQELVKGKAKHVKKHLRNIKQNSRLSESQEDLLKSLNKENYPRFFEEAILEASNLICGTMIGILQHPLIKNGTIDVPFDVMIVDEASKVTFQEFLVPALYAKKWVLVGDVQQLSPYVEGEYVEIALDKLLKEEQKQHLQTVFPIWKASHYEPKKHHHNRLKILLSNDFDQQKAKNDFAEHLAVFDLDKDFKNPINDTLALNAADIVLAKNTKQNRTVLEKYIYVKAEVFDGFINGEFQRVQRFYKNTNYVQSKRERSTWESELGHRLSQHYSFRSDLDLGKHLEKDIDFLTSYDLIINEKHNKSLKEEVERIKRITMPSILEMLQNGLGKTVHKNQRLNRIIYDGFPLSAKRLKFVSLSYQHRMNDLIAQTSRNHFYKNGKKKEQLKTANTVTDRKNPLSTYKSGEQDVIWQTNASKTEYDSKRKRRLNANETESNDIINEIQDFLKWVKTTKPKEKNEPFEVAVLCFYRDQEALMRKKLRRLYKKYNHSTKRLPFKNFDFGQAKVTLCTVDRFQGDEADMVLLSFTKASTNAFYKSPNRLNVALTRARYKLVLFGNRKFFKDRNISKALTELAQFDVRKSSGQIRKQTSKRSKYLKK